MVLFLESTFENAFEKAGRAMVLCAKKNKIKTSVTRLGVYFSDQKLMWKQIQIIKVQTSNQLNFWSSHTNSTILYWDDKQKSQAQSDCCKMQMAFRSARWRFEFLGTAWSNKSDANSPEGDTKPPGGNNPWSLLFNSSIMHFQE